MFILFLSTLFGFKYFLVDKIYKNKNEKVESIRKLLIEKLIRLDFTDKYLDNKNDIDINNETLKKINSINDNLLMIKQVQINDLENDKSPLDIPFRKMNDIQRCKVLFEIYFSLSKFINENKNVTKIRKICIPKLFLMMQIKISLMIKSKI